MKRRRILAALAAAFLCLAVLLGAGEVLSHPHHRPVGAAPGDLPASPVRFDTVTGQSLAGWLVRGDAGAGAVLLLHGIGADRRQMLGRARFLHRLGYSVLLIDLPAHGESAGDRVTFGWNESQGVAAALDYLSDALPDEKIGVIGASLGAASLVLSRPDLSLEAVVLESMFPTIEDAVSDRLAMYLGPAGRWLTPLLLWQLPVRLGVSADQLRPIADLPSLHVPLLIAAGSEDRHTPLAETRRIYAAADDPKALWVVDGAAHVDLHGFDPPAYEARISAFLAKHLRDSD
ncbi:alpha/beta fold hydrolase [Acidovorax sp. SUPP2825]|uniref:alpha/beta hydrolase n=1 Tax=Acidovorax sp. SUPP2825 TaxID=2920879 RepID=UPI0023DE25EB|nr:alpha/beta fold hydrolase [Acidovorax sp. SUPP2825]GKS97473.1 alpha/beta fold hydrolase [Acidovorax sp. SUPP2825]